MLEGVSRIRIRSIIKESPYRLLDTEALKPLSTKNNQPCVVKVTMLLCKTRKLGGEVTNETLEYLNVVDDDTTFIDLAVFTLCKNTIRKQAMLRFNDCIKVEMFFDDLIKKTYNLLCIKILPTRRNS